MQRFTVQPEQVGRRLDVFLVECLPELSRSSLSKLVSDEKVVVNDAAQPVRYKVRLGDVVSVYFDPKDLTEIPAIELPILYEDDDCLVINKPAGVLTHSKGGFNPEATVASFIRDKVDDMDGERAGIVHRLDRATSGVIICAKNNAAMSWLQKQFSSRKVKKEYNAVIEGSLQPPAARIEAAIARNPRSPKTFIVAPQGKSAITSYETEKTATGHSLLVLHPETGRTHQLRVHLAYLKHPIVGDPLYNGQIYERMLLHAHSLEITLPNKQRKVFTAPLPDEFEEIFHG